MTTQGAELRARCSTGAYVQDEQPREGDAYIPLSPMVAACSAGDVGMVRQCSLPGVHTDASLRNGETFLHVAVENGHNQVVALLLSMHADAEARDTHGFTALQRAVLRRPETSQTIRLIETLLQPPPPSSRSSPAGSTRPTSRAV